MSSFIPADQTFAILATLFAIALFGFWAESKAWGKLLTGAVWAILASIVLTNLNIIPKQAAAYDVVFSYFVPLLLPLFLMHANVKQIISESGRVGIAFILACLGTISGALIAAALLDLGIHENVLAGMFTATYTGGSANFAAVVQSTGFDDANILSAATAVDNLLGILFLMLILLMPASEWLMHFFIQRGHHTDDIVILTKEEHEVSGQSLAASLFFALAIVALSDTSVSILNLLTHSDWSILRYLFITLFSVISASLFPQQMEKMHGGHTIGLVLALVFFATIAAGADVRTILSHAPQLLLFVLIILLIHWIVVFIGGALLTKGFKKLGKEKDFGLSMPELIIASNAAILGATTAPALAMARGWNSLVTPGILVGVAGYVIGTPLGLLIATW